MLEAIQCPTCSTRYGLRRERILPRHKRARCFRCQGEFPIGSHVASLLSLPAMEAAEDATSTMRFQVEELQHAPGAAAVLDPAGLLAESEDGPEKALVAEAPAAPHDRSPAVPVPEPPPEERTASGAEAPSDGRITGSYRSAKDAIGHLFKDTPMPIGRKPGRQTVEKVVLEVEATMEALEHTLGSAPGEAKEAPAPVPVPPPAALPHPEDPARMRAAAPAPPPALPAEPLHPEDLPLSSGATQRMSLSEIQAAIKTPEPAAPAPESQAATKELDAAEVTQMMNASRLARQQSGLAAANPESAFPSTSPAGDDPNLLRLRIGEDVYPNLSMDQLTRWVEEGRVLESHQVARQFSENWIEAHKVPGLRPVFERLKRSREGALPVVIESGTPAKKSLFGGLFGKKD